MLHDMCLGYCHSMDKGALVGYKVVSAEIQGPESA